MVHQSLVFVCAVGVSYYAYRTLSHSPTARPKVTDTEVPHATRAPNPILYNDGGQPAIAPRAPSNAGEIRIIHGADGVVHFG
jgi:hypothetical protein